MPLPKPAQLTIAIALPAAASGIGCLLGHEGSTEEPANAAATPAAAPAAAHSDAPTAAAIWQEGAKSKETRESFLTDLAARPSGDWSSTDVSKLAWYADDDPAAVASLVSQLTDGQRVRPTLAVAAYWATTDPQATLAWLADLMG